MGEVSRRRDAGHAMLLVLLLASLFLGVWLVVHRAANDTVTVQRSVVQRDRFEERITRALAYAAELLSAGRPAGANYAFVYAGQDVLGPFHTTVTLSRAGVASYDADAREATPVEIATLPLNPPGF